MSSDFNRTNIDHYLYLVAKEYKKINRADPEAEIIVVGGASMIINYNFRDSTTDIDSIIRASSSMKEVINRVGDENGLQTGWLNDDFRNTASYSHKLIEYSHFYKRFCNCLNVRTVSDEYILAMKVKSARIYKHDLSDIIGIIKEHQEMNKELTFRLVNEAYHKLYNEEIQDEVADKLKRIFECEDLEELFYSTKEEESMNMLAANKAEEEYQGAVNVKNIDSFIEHFRKSHQMQNNKK
jgi:hypothetical protein